MATRMQQRRGTAAEWTSANPILGAGEIGFETDSGQFKIGDGSTQWANLAYFSTVEELTASFTLEDISDVGFNDGPSDKQVLAYDANLEEWKAVDSLGDVEITTPSENDTILYDATSGKWINKPGIELDQDGNIELALFSNLVAGASQDWGTLGAIESYVTSNYALSADVPELTVKTENDWTSDTTVLASGSINVELGSEVRLKIGNGTDTFANLDYVPSIASVDSQIAAGITEKADLDSPTFTGDVTLPSGTSIGLVSGTEIGYLSGVTSGIQSQIDDLDSAIGDLDLAKADLASPTFTGTVSGITSSMVGLGNVDNTSDLDKPISTATQTALDGKLSLSGGTMTGKITLDSDPTQALHAVTKQYVDSVEAGLITRPAVKAATTANLSGTYNNGTAGVGATLNLGQLATLDIDGITSWSQWNGILVKNQTNAFENGRYVVFQLGNDTDIDWILRRCPLCDEADEIPGSYIFVTDGTVNAQTGWVQHVDDPATFTVGTDDIDVYQFAGAGTITAGTNVSVSGNQVSVVDAPVFSGTIDASAAGVEFSDGVQTKAGVPSLTTFVEKTASYTLDTLDHQDNIIEMNSASAVTFTIPTNSALAWPVGASMDIFQTGAGEVTIAGDSGVTVNATPGLKLRTQWSSATILKRGTDSWVVYGDLKS